MLGLMFHHRKSCGKSKENSSLIHRVSIELEQILTKPNRIVILVRITLVSEDNWNWETISDRQVDKQELTGEKFHSFVPDYHCPQTEDKTICCKSTVNRPSILKASEKVETFKDTVRQK